MASTIEQIAADEGISDIFTLEFAELMDSKDELKEMKGKYLFPDAPDAPGSSGDRKKAIYLCGNSLGLQPKGLRSQVTDQLDKWAEQGVEGHFTEPTQWLTIDDIVQVYPFHPTAF